jgi:hypothetical protein
MGYGRCNLCSFYLPTFSVQPADFVDSIAPMDVDFAARQSKREFYGVHMSGHHISIHPYTAFGGMCYHGPKIDLAREKPYQHYLENLA